MTDANANTSGTVHVIGAGLAGLSAAVRLAGNGRKVCLYEATDHAGGRCRSFFEPALERTIDNGNHLLLSANTEALDYLSAIGARHSLLEGEAPIFPFCNVATDARWSVRPNAGPLPYWLLAPSRRIPGTKLSDYLPAAKFAFAKPETTVGDLVSRENPLYDSFWHPFTVAVLNTQPEEASAQLLWAVIAKTFVRGGAHCRPMIAGESLAASFVDPALAHLETLSADVRFGSRLQEIVFADGRASELLFSGERIALRQNDAVVLAVPAAVAVKAVPDLVAPLTFRPIVNAHIRLPEPAALPGGAPLLGIVGGTADWLFLRGDVASLTVSAADDLADLGSDEIAAKLWADTARALQLDPEPMPPVRIIKERRATFAQTPEEVAKRPAAQTQWDNLVLAGDYTDTGLPATIEGAITSGHRAAAIVGGV